MATVEIVRAVYHAGQVLGVGTVVEIPDGVASMFIASGKAKKAAPAPKPRRQRSPKTDNEE